MFKLQWKIETIFISIATLRSNTINLKTMLLSFGFKFYFQAVLLNLFYSMSTWYTPKHEYCNTFLPNRILQVKPFPLYKSRNKSFLPYAAKLHFKSFYKKMILCMKKISLSYLILIMMFNNFTFTGRHKVIQKHCVPAKCREN